MKVEVITVIVGAIRIVAKSLEKRLEKRKAKGIIQIVRITALLKFSRILRRVFLLLRCLWKKVKTGTKISQGIKW